MAQKVKIILEDDLDGGPADESVRFGLDGGQYEMDLTKENAANLREALRPYAAVARRETTKNRRGARRARQTPQRRNSETQKIREWAKQNGYSVSDRGRIPKDMRELYYATNSAS